MHRVMKAGLCRDICKWWSWTTLAVFCALGAIRSTYAVGGPQPNPGRCDAAHAVSDQGPIVPRLPGSAAVRELYDHGKKMHWARRRVLVKRDSPGLDQWLRITRERLLGAGARPIPAPLATRFATTFPQGLIRRARYIVSGELFEAVGEAPFRFDDADAVTVVNVIVFRDVAAAGRELSWVRELARIKQFERWGVDAFARKYLESWRRLDREARREVAKYTTATHERPWPGLELPGEGPDGAQVAQSGDSKRDVGCGDNPKG